METRRGADEVIGAVALLLDFSETLPVFYFVWLFRLQAGEEVEMTISTTSIQGDRSAGGGAPALRLHSFLPECLGMMR